MAKTELGMGLPQDPEPRDIQVLLKKAEGTDAEFMVSRLALRTMMQAKYSPRERRGTTDWQAPATATSPRPSDAMPT